jgi:hypothetical protein
MTLALFMLHGPMATSAFAQSIVAVRPVFNVTHAYDSNLFSSADRPQGYFVMRMTPGIEAERRSPVTGLLARYAADFEHMARPSSMTAAATGQAALVRMRYGASRRMSTSIETAYTRTRTPGQLSPVPGLTLGRITAERLEVHPIIVRNLDGLASATVEYSFTRDHATGTGEMLSHRTGVGIDRQVSRRDFVGVTYDLEAVTFEAGEDRTTHRVRAGWSRPLTRLISMAARAGLATTGQTNSPDIQASISHRLRSADLAMTYGRTQTTVLGLGGVMDIESLAATGSLQPQRGVVLRFTPAASRIRQGSGRLEAWRLGFDVTRRVQYGEVRVSYETSAQRGVLSGPIAGGRVMRHLAQVAFAFSAREASCEACDMVRAQ